MKLLTKEIIKKATGQYDKGSDLDSQQVVAKFFNPCGDWTWYLMNLDPDDMDYAWGIVDGFAMEIGSFSISELESVKGPLGIGIERDMHFKPVSAKEIWNNLI
tara:strand:- start:459 stop:767 length:309 start_codon:yes stop_codon:yes gene_type:complete